MVLQEEFINVPSRFIDLKFRETGQFIKTYQALEIADREWETNPNPPYQRLKHPRKPVRTPEDLEQYLDTMAAQGYGVAELKREIAAARRQRQKEEGAFSPVRHHELHAFFIHDVCTNMSKPSDRARKSAMQLNRRRTKSTEKEAMSWTVPYVGTLHRRIRSLPATVRKYLTSPVLDASTTTPKAQLETRSGSSCVQTQAGARHHLAARRRREHSVPKHWKLSTAYNSNPNSHKQVWRTSRDAPFAILLPYAHPSKLTGNSAVAIQNASELLAEDATRRLMRRKPAKRPERTRDSTSDTR